MLQDCMDFIKRTSRIIVFPIRMNFIKKREIGSKAIKYIGMKRELSAMEVMKLFAIKLTYSKVV